MTGVENHALCQVFENPDQDAKTIIAFGEKCEDDIHAINQDSRVTEFLSTQPGFSAASNSVNDKTKHLPSNEMSNVIKWIIGTCGSFSDQSKFALSSVVLSLKETMTSDG